MIRANDPSRTSWVEVKKDSDFPIQNLPFGVFTTADDINPRVGVAIGEKILDLKALHILGHIPNQPLQLQDLDCDSLNPMMSYGKNILREFRNRISDILSIDNPELKIQLIGHTDNVGSEKFNLKLSQYRAQTMKDYLVDAGVEESRIITGGKGMREPLNDNSTEEKRALNRRVELTILYEKE